MILHGTSWAVTTQYQHKNMKIAMIQHELNNLQQHKHTAAGTRTAYINTTWKQQETTCNTKAVTHTTAQQHESNMIWTKAKNGSLCLEKPSCLQTTFASSLPQPTSHTVCHLSKWHTSTRPSLATAPPINRTSPWRQKTIVQRMKRWFLLIYLYLCLILFQFEIRTFY